MERPKILIVDDREENLLALERILERADAGIVKASSGNEALKACLNCEFALALLDVNMPGMNGYELAELMRGQKSLSTIPIIFLTAARVQEQQVFAGYSCGAVDYLIKPLQPEILLNKVAVFLDLHRQKQELLQRSRELELLNSELRRTREDAIAASQSKSSFLADLSHEIRTPISCLMWMAEALLNSPLSEEQKGLVELVQQSGRHLLALINDSLDLARIEASNLRYQSGQFDLRETFNEVTIMLALAAQKKGIALRLKVAPEIPVKLWGDAGRLRQIVTNLVGNAVKFTEQGEVRIEVGLVDQDEEEVRLRCEIQDTGIGISEQNMVEIFNPFFQVPSAYEAKEGGTGLGLSICQKLVELFDGEIGVESTEGVGSTFWFTAVLRKTEPTRSALHGGTSRPFPVKKRH